MPNQNVLLVAGFNYENILLQRCNNRMARLLAKSKSAADLTFTLFGVGGGVIRQNQADPKTRERSWTEKRRFTPVTAANYSSFVNGSENHFDKNPAGILSITDLYSFVQDIGAGADKGTVEELASSRMGEWVGSILVNSFDNLPRTALMRDPNDKDARQWKDFIAPNMDDKALANFHAAFTDTCIVWTWGCSFFAPRTWCSQLFKTSKFRSTPLGKLRDTDSFILDFSEDNPHPSPTDDFNRVVNSLVPGGRLSGRNYTVTVTLSQIIDTFETQLSNTYASKVANATPSGGTTFAALPGTGADYEDPENHGYGAFSTHLFAPRSNTGDFDHRTAQRHNPVGRRPGG
jgi:hypothetical protein